jgi:O-antigen/teichoic acid export membrane protein
MGTVSSVLRVLSSNVVALIVGMINGFVVPRMLGITEYGLLKTFTLYASYIGVFSLGFVDGIYLKYGGSQQKSINKLTLRKELLVFVLTEASISAILLAVSLFSVSVVLFLFSIFLVGSAISGFIRMFFQATGRFRDFSLLNVFSPLSNLIATVIVLFLLGVERAYALILSQIVVTYISVLIFLPRMFKNLSSEEQNPFSSRIARLFTIGFPIMLGNLSAILFYSMDRWFVKVLLKTEDFAFYSFATSMMGMVMILVSSVAMTFYPMLVRRQEEEGLLRTLKSYLMILGALAGAAYFGFDFIVNLILRDFLPSLEVIAILFAGFPAIAVINAIYVNMYKAQKVEKKYFFTVFGMMAVSFGLNVLAVIISKSNWTIAAATTIAFYFWFFFSSKDFNGTRTNLREIAYLAGFLLVFFSTTRLFSWWIGLPLYVAGILGITLLFYMQEFLDLTRKVLGAFKTRTSQN